MNCHHCQSINVRKNGRDAKGRQVWYCKDCGRRSSQGADLSDTGGGRKPRKWKDDAERMRAKRAFERKIKVEQQRFDEGQSLLTSWPTTPDKINSPAPFFILSENQTIMTISEESLTAKQIEYIESVAATIGCSYSEALSSVLRIVNTYSTDTDINRRQSRTKPKGFGSAIQPQAK